MANNSILTNINGEYVKFYYTTNSVLPEILKRSGAIVIYDNVENNSDKFGYNYKTIYLGGEEIASGIGFHSKELRDNIIDIYHEFPSYCAYSYTNIGILYSYYANINNEYLTKDGIINDTYLYTTLAKDNTYTLIHTTDLITNSIEAQYTPAHITYEETIINYLELEDVNRYVVSTINGTGTFDENNIKTKKFLNDEPINLPIGTLITKYTKNININLEDEDNVEWLYSHVNYHLFDHIQRSNNIDTSNYTYVNEFSMAPNNVSISLNNCLITLEQEYNLTYNISNAHTFLVKEGKNILSDSTYIATSGVKIYKEEQLSQSTNTKFVPNDDKLKKIKISLPDGTQKETSIYSIKHILQPNVLQAKDVVINGVAPLIIYTTSNNVTLPKTKTLNVGKRVMLEAINKVQIPANTSRLYIGVPKDTIIKNIYYIDQTNDNAKVNITGLFINFANQDNTIPSCIDAFPCLFNSGTNNILPDETLYYNYKFLFLDYANTIDYKFEECEIIIECENYEKLTSFVKHGKEFEEIYFNPSNTVWNSQQNDEFINHNWVTPKNNGTLESIYTNLSNLTGHEFKFGSFTSFDDNKYKYVLSYWNQLKTLNNLVPTNVTYETTIQLSHDMNRYNIIPKYYIDNTFIKYSLENCLNSGGTAYYTYIMPNINYENKFLVQNNEYYKISLPSNIIYDTSGKNCSKLSLINNTFIGIVIINKNDNVQNAINDYFNQENIRYKQFNYTKSIKDDMEYSLSNMTMLSENVIYNNEYVKRIVFLRFNNLHKNELGIIEDTTTFVHDFKFGNLLKPEDMDNKYIYYIIPKALSDNGVSIKTTWKSNEKTDDEKISDLVTEEFINMGKFTYKCNDYIIYRPYPNKTFTVIENGDKKYKLFTCEITTHRNK